MILDNKYINIPINKSSTKTYGFVLNSLDQIHKLMLSELDKKVYYKGDKPPLNVSEWANQIAKQANKRKPLVFPYMILSTAAKFGDILKVFGVNFPLNTFRLKNMTINNIVQLSDLYQINGNQQYSVQEGIDITLAWFKEHLNCS